MNVAVAFAAAVRRHGVDVPVGSVVLLAEALDAVGLERRDGVYWAGRAALVRRPEDAPAYDRAFSAFWTGEEGDEMPVVSLGAEEPELGLDADGDKAGTQAEPGVPSLVVRFSPREVLRHKDFAAYSHDELAEARRLMADLRLAGALRRSRRLRPSRRGGRPDVRATVRAAFATGGEVVRRPRKATSQRPRRIVLLCDVSGSMDPYARALARFLHTAVAGGRRVEAFAVGTRLTRLTRELSTRDPDAALAAAARAVVDWSGGTRLGEGLRRFNDEWGVRGLARGAVVVVLSDGWDRGDPGRLAQEMARLRRVAHRIVWVNPLKATPGYAPLARGMAAALPYVDELVEGHSLASLEALSRVIAR
ncbi:MAG TPA: VWA domain-containing protein [Acidimicrobiales bacterium]|nr:VWA domain-containing protein [Acidimicrobiales bacterium]